MFSVFECRLFFNTQLLHYGLALKFINAYSLNLKINQNLFLVAKISEIEVFYLGQSKTPFFNLYMISYNSSPKRA